MAASARAHADRAGRRPAGRRPTTAGQPPPAIEKFARPAEGYHIAVGGTVEREVAKVWYSPRFR